MEVDLYDSKNQTYWTDPELGYFGAQAVTTNGYVSSLPPTTFQPLPQPQVLYWTPPKQPPKVIKPEPEIVKPEPVRSYIAYQVFAFLVTVFCNCVFGAVAWVLAREYFSLLAKSNDVIPPNFQCQMTSAMFEKVASVLVYVWFRQ